MLVSVQALTLIPDLWALSIRPLVMESAKALIQNSRPDFFFSDTAREIVLPVIASDRIPMAEDLSARRFIFSRLEVLFSHTSQTVLEDIPPLLTMLTIFFACASERWVLISRYSVSPFSLQVLTVSFRVGIFWFP